MMFVFLCLLTLGLKSNSQSTNLKPKELFKKAETQLKANEIDQALNTYADLWNGGYFNKSSLQNMALAYYQKKDWANARFYIEQLSQRYSLDEEWERLYDDLAFEINDTATFSQSLMGALVLWLRRTLGFQVFPIILLLSSFLLAACLLFTIPNRKWILRIGLVVFCIGLIGIIIENIEDRKTFMIVQSDTILHRAPDEISEALTAINSGHKVLILQFLGDWTEVQTANESTGWVHTRERIL